MKFLILLLLLLLTQSLFVSAQIKPISTHYNFLRGLNNPAFYGLKDGISVAANYRYQWTKIEGAPQTLNLVGDAYLPSAHGGIGFNVSNDRVGAYSHTYFNAGYNFVLKIKDKFKIGIGVSAGADFAKLDGSKLVTPDGDYSNNPDHQDDLLSAQMMKTIRPNIGLGVSFSWKYLDVGVAYTNVINAKDKFKGTAGDLRSKYGSVLETIIGSKIDVGEHFTVMPSICLNTDFINLQTDITFMAGYEHYVALGVNVRGYNKSAFEALSPVLKIEPVKHFGIIYSYDVSLNKLNPVNNGTHEITLNYYVPNSKLYKNPKSINHPRFL
jgi:type IX secretion system PorP/SprF family membrane protein